MKKLVLLLMLVLITSACGEKDDSSFEDEKVPRDFREDRDEEDDDDKDKEKDREDDGDIAITNEEYKDNGEGILSFETITGSTEWPDDLKDIPEFTYGDISAIKKVSDHYDGIDYLAYNIEYKNVSKGSAHDYASEIDDAGLRNTYGPEETEMPGTDATSIQYEYDLYMFETEETTLRLSLMFWTDDKGKGGVFVSIPIKPNGVTSDGESDTERDSENDESEAEENGGEDETGSDNNSEEFLDSINDQFLDGEFPEGYPHDIAPLYNGDYDVIGGEAIDADGTPIYIVIIGTRDDFDTVNKSGFDEIINNADEVIMDMDAMGTRMIMYKKGDWTVTITCTSEESELYADADYGAVINYSAVYEGD